MDNQILLLIIAGVLLQILLLFIVFNVLRRTLRRQLRQRFPPDSVRKATLAANCFGLKSKGPLQIRGNGALVLLEDELFFRMLAPPKELHIPLDHIRSLSYTKSFLGKGCVRPLLCVTFDTPHGQDAVAFALPNASEWKTALEQLTHTPDSD